MFFVYALYNSTADKIYIGQTCDLENRLLEHNQGKFRGYTSRFLGNWTVIYHETFSTRTEAIKREKELKSFRGREFIRKQIPK